MISDSFYVLLALQAFHVSFLCLHDWIPLAPLNDVKAVRAASPGNELLKTTVVSALPFAFGFAASIVYLKTSHPSWIFWYLWISYGILFIGELRAWWIPYLVRPEPERAMRYAAMFGNTAGFLPEHNGIRPNALHLILHAVTLATLICLGAIRMT